MKKIFINIILINLLIFTNFTSARPLVEDSIIGLYVAYYNRSPDKKGYDYWVQQADINKDLSSLLNISNSFSKNPKFKENYPSSDTNVQFITKIYKNILNRLPDKAGLDFWVNSLDRGLSKSEFVVNYVNNILDYEGVDPIAVTSKNMFLNKVIMSKCFIDALSSDSNGDTNSIAYTRSIDILSEITEKEDSLYSAIDKIESYLPKNTELPEICPSKKDKTTSSSDNVINIQDSVCIDIPVNPINIPVGSVAKYKISYVDIDSSIYNSSPTNIEVEMIEVGSDSYKEKYTYTYPQNKISIYYSTTTYSTDNNYIYIDKIQNHFEKNILNNQISDIVSLYSPSAKYHEINRICLDQTWESTYDISKSIYNKFGEIIQTDAINISQTNFIESIDIIKSVNFETYRTYKRKQQIDSNEVTTWVDILNGLYVYREFHNNTGKLLKTIELTSYIIGGSSTSSDTNTAPIANNDTNSTPINTSLTLSNLLSNDTDRDNDILSISKVDSRGSEGSMIINNHDGTVTYTPNTGFTGTETFNYTLSDGKNIATAHVTITVVDNRPKFSFSCSGKKTCGRMSSCAEAVFYLNQCGVTRLDRDKDGIPCESICK